jgi:succinate dehydrogenase / fumarate reductase flavoprotein subunit
MQGLADGYFVLPYTIGNYLSPLLGEAPVDTGHDAFKQAEKTVRERIDQLLSIGGTRTVDWFHRELGKILWDYCGMGRNREGLKKALSEIPALRAEFEADVRVLGDDASLNESLEKAGRVEDFFELAELMCIDALDRDESCGAHFREEHQTAEGEALRNDEDYSYVAAWERSADGGAPTLHKEHLEFEYVALSQRSYK